jgi:hypothetical protein
VRREDDFIELFHFECYGVNDHVNMTLFLVRLGIFKDPDDFNQIADFNGILDSGITLDNDPDFGLTSRDNAVFIAPQNGRHVFKGEILERRGVKPACCAGDRSDVDASAFVEDGVGRVDINIDVCSLIAMTRPFLAR